MGQTPYYKNYKFYWPQCHYNSMIIILEKEKVTREVRERLLKKGLSLIGMSDKEIIFAKFKRYFH